MTKTTARDRGPTDRSVGRRGLLGIAVAAGAAACTGQSTAAPSTSGQPTAGQPTPGQPTAAQPGTGAPTATQSGPSGGAPSGSAASGATDPSASAHPPVGTPVPGAPAVEVGHGDRTGTTVALTFHGAGDSALARELLSVLGRAKVTVTVLAVGTWLRDESATARAFLAAGHELGNHTMNHREMRTLSTATAEREIEGCKAELVRVTGSPQTWFRASGTQHTTARIRAAAGRSGYARCLSYDVDGLDWQDPSAATVVRAVLDGTKPGSVVSLHLGHRVTLEALPAILSGLQRTGLRPVGVSEVLA